LPLFRSTQDKEPPHLLAANEPQAELLPSCIQITSGVAKSSLLCPSGTILVSGHFPAYSMTDILDKAIPIRQNKTSYKKMRRNIYAPFVVLYLVARQPYCTRHSMDVVDLD
jgi:hypothetical protein